MRESAVDSESMFPPQYWYGGPRNSTPAVALRYGADNDFNQTFDGRPADPFSPANNVYAAIYVPSTLARTPAPQPAVSPFTPCMSQSVRRGYAERAHDYYSAPHCDAPLPQGRELDSSGYGQPSWRRAKSAPQRHSSCMVRGSDYVDSSDDEQYKQRERIPTLQPGRFDGSGSWKDFLHLFESCAEANHWSEKTRTVQLRFSLTGAAGAIVHKNPRSTRWSYQRIVDEVDAAYGPCSEHAATIGIELRQRVRGSSEALHSLRDDIYEKVSIVYADRTEREQDAISVEIFTNALADAEVVQRLLEERPRTLARAYEVAHRYETTRRAARADTQLMQPGQRSSAERRARAATVHEETSVMLCDEPVGVAVASANPPDRKSRFHQQWPAKKNRNVEMFSTEIICHNCSGVGHLQRNCPSPRRPKQHTPSVNLTPAPHPSTVVTCTSGLEGEMSVKILIHGLEVCALLDSAAQRNVLPLHHFDSIPVESRPPIQPSTTEVLQGIGPKGLTVMGEVTLPVHAGSRITNMNFIIADTAEGTEVILGHPFLRQARAHLDYGRRGITLYVEKVPRFDPNHQPEVHIVRVACTTVLASGCEYVVPGTARVRHTADGDMMLSPTKGFIEKHHVLVAHIVVQTQQSTNIPIRVFNPGTAPVTLRKGAVAGLLQPVKVMVEVGLQPTEASTVSEPVSSDSVSVPSHLQSLYTESCASLSEDDRSRMAHLLQSYSNVFSTGPTDLGRTNLVQHDILTTPGPRVKQPPRRMASDKQLAADQQVQQSLESGVAQPSNSSWAAPIVMHKAVQCSLDGVSAEEAAMETFTEKPPVGVVELDDRSTSKPEFPPVGVEDTSSDDSCGHTSTHPSIHRVNESLHANLFCSWTQEQLNNAQLTDPDISPVRKWMDTGDRPSWTDVAPCSPTTKAYWAQWKRLYWSDGVLLRKFYCTEGQAFYPQILLPRLYRASVMQQMHDGPVGGHFGVERTLARLKARYFRYSMKDDVTLWCRTCTSCAAKAHPKKTPQAAMGTVRVGAPTERIAVDLMGPLNEKERRNRYILVVQDYFSKLVGGCLPCPQQASSDSGREDCLRVGV
ncbi:hypothetical protein ABVT39_001512 [Epinephelus coioides]